MNKTIALIAIVVAVAIFSYPFITGGSESLLVSVSYFAFPLLIFGIVGSRTGNLKNAAIAAAISFLLLFGFFAVVWPNL